jgi:hypothetical protein
LLIALAAAMPAIALAACNDTAGVSSADGAAGDDAGADAPPTDVPLAPFRFSSVMDAHLEAGPLLNEAGRSLPTTVCCDSAIGCYTSQYPAAGTCDDQTDGTQPPLGDSVRLLFRSSTGGLSMTVQTDEPADGFTGACLLGPDGRISDHAQLPVVCFSPQGNVQYGVAASTTEATMTEVIVRAAEVVQSDTPAAANFDVFPYTADYASYHYQVLMTCYPKDAGGACAGGTPVSRSCCDVGANMQYLYANLAHGFVDLASQ